jgi:hypothetical protein
MRCSLREVVRSHRCDRAARARVDVARGGGSARADSGIR